MILTLKLMNKAYMAKLRWKLAQGQPNLAHKCIMSKYMYRNRATKFKNGSVIWRNVGLGWDVLSQNSI